MTKGNGKAKRIGNIHYRVLCLVIIAMISSAWIPVLAGRKDNVSKLMGKLKYGIFIHYVPGLTVYKNGVVCNNLDSLANNFNALQFADDIYEMGAQYIIFTAWHSKSNVLYPSKAMDYWRPGHSAKRDMIGDMLQAVNAKGIKVFLYTHPRDGFEDSDVEKEKTGWGKGTNAERFADPFWNNFNYQKWNDYINDIYAELVEKYGNRIAGLYLDEGSDKGDSYRLIDYARLRKTIKKFYPHLILLQNNYGRTYGLDVAVREYAHWGEFASTDGNTWPAYTIPVTTLISANWYATRKLGLPAVDFSVRALARYIILQAGTNTAGGGVQLAAGLYADGGWETGVRDTLLGVGKVFRLTRPAIFNTIPSSIFETNSGKTIRDLQWGIATSSGDENYEYLHILKIPEDKNLRIFFSNGAIKFKNAIALLNGEKLSLTQDGKGVTISLPKSLGGDIDLVIRMQLQHPQIIPSNHSYINDTDTGIVYRQSWEYPQVVRNHGDFDADVHITDTDGDYFTFPFTGKGIDVIASKGIEQGICEIYIDGIFEQKIDGTGNKYVAQEILFSIRGLPYRQHIIKVVKAGGKTMSLDALKVYR